MRTDQHHLTFRAIADEGGASLRESFDRCWPGYRRWMRRATALPTDECIGQLRAHMPELMPTFDRLLALVGDDERHARFLTLYCPPRLVRGCSQVVLDSPEGPILLRTYDHSPGAFDGLVLSSRWTSARTLAVTDCLWGALDGLNERGLAVALAFGGRNAIGPGFAAPLVVRYLLETCATAGQAAEVLKRVPVYMPYTFVVADAGGEFITAFTGPDRPVMIRRARASTNHQAEDDWPEYRDFARSIERLDCIHAVLERGGTFEDHLEACLRPPVWRTDHSHGAGTLYAAAYRPGVGGLDLHWPGRTEGFALSAFHERSFTVALPSHQRARAGSDG